MQHLEDSFGRKFPYIRMSITDVCNLNVVIVYQMVTRLIKVIIENFFILMKLNVLQNAFLN